MRDPLSQPELPAERGAPPAEVPYADRRVAVPDTPDARAATGVVRRLREAGHSAFLVGGCVRDLVLGLVPKDYDVATSARPEAVSALFPRVVEVGVAFGVVLVLAGERGAEVEVATYRADGAYHDGRRPTEVRFTDAREDVLRRDFTLNGLLLDPLAAGGGQVIDWVDGIGDLDRGVLRAIGEPSLRFEEDALRLLRAARFAARFGLAIDPATAAAMADRSATLARISRERVQAELAGMLKVPYAPAAVSLLARFGLAQTLWPALTARDPGLAATRARLQALCDQALSDGPSDTSAQADGLPPSRGLAFELALAAFLWPLHLPGGALPDDVHATLRLSGAALRTLRNTWDQADALLACLRDATLPALDPTSPRLVRLLREPESDAAVRLALAALAADPALGALHPAALAWLGGLRHLRKQAQTSRWRPRLYVDGARLKALGHPPSPRFRVALAAAEDTQLRGGDDRAALAAALAALPSLD